MFTIVFVSRTDRLIGEENAYLQVLTVPRLDGDTLEDHSESTRQVVEELGMTVKSYEKTTLAGKPAYRMDLIEDGANVIMISTVNERHGFNLKYAAEEPAYSNHLLEAQHFFDSFRFANAADDANEQNQSSTSSVTARPDTSDSKPSNVFMVEDFYLFGSPEDQYYEAQFSLFDENHQEVAAAGTVKITIYDDADNILYQDTFSVTESDFALYETVLGGEKVALVWTIPSSDVESGTGNGGAKLTFTTLDGKVVYKAADNFVSIPH